MRIGFIGAGVMANAIIKGAILSGIVMSGDICVSDMDTKKLESIQMLGIDTFPSNLDVAKNSDIIILSIKPQVYSIVINELKQFDDKIYVTLAPGISIEKVKSFFNNEKTKVVRTMPNTPAMVNEGMTVLTYKEPVTEAEFNFVKSIFDGLGKTVVLDEKLMDASVALSGSSPAYVFMFIEAMADNAVKHGIDHKTALMMAAQSVLGSAKMVLESGQHPAELKTMVCSPGGTTIRAVQELERTHFKSSVMSAMDECVKRAKELS